MYSYTVFVVYFSLALPECFFIWYINGEKVWEKDLVNVTIFILETSSFERLLISYSL